jgi:hypothetical protein
MSTREQDMPTLPVYKRDSREKDDKRRKIGSAEHCGKIEKEQ